MTNRIDKTLENAKQTHRKIISPYITAGDPGNELTVPLMHALVEGGADILEIGIPFSDPMAEGPVIQHAMERALSHHVCLADIFAMISEFRTKNNDTPIVLMGYLNPIEIYGYEPFAEQASRCGVDGTILVDLPPEEAADMLPVWRQHGLHPIFLCSPTTSEKRFQAITEVASGYLYYVSLKGVTGASSLSVADVRQVYQDRKKSTSLPLLVGFGIKNAETAAEITSFADGIVIGAALIDTIFHQWESHEDVCAAATNLIAEMRQSINHSES